MPESFPKQQYGGLSQPFGGTTMRMEGTGWTGPGSVGWQATGKQPAFQQQPGTIQNAPFMGIDGASKPQASQPQQADPMRSLMQQHAQANRLMQLLFQQRQMPPFSAQQLQQFTRQFPGLGPQMFRDTRTPLTRLASAAPSPPIGGTARTFG